MQISKQILNERLTIETLTESGKPFSRIIDNSINSIIVIPFTLNYKTNFFDSVFLHDRLNRFTNTRYTSALVIDGSGYESETDACIKVVSKTLQIPESRINVADRMRYCGELIFNVSSFSCSYVVWAINVTDLKKDYKEKIDIESIQSTVIDKTTIDLTNINNLPNDLLVKIPYQQASRTQNYSDGLLAAAMNAFSSNLIKGEMVKM